MGIQALPQTTVRTLGASQVLTDPAAVIKELIDNSLDAQATSIAIEISANTLDVIQVRDNGHGIPPDDRLLVARPHCTSKISCEDDLTGIGGSSLGFRGEALASMAEMSGSLTISTRIEGEPVAAALKINRLGEVTGQERASLPIGTTVRITDFIKLHPVRKQFVLKSTEKTLKKVKQVLQSYAFARPHVRYSLRVLKAKNDKGNWMYAPKPAGNAEDAAFKIVGAACASQCTWSVVEEHGFTLQAFLPRPDADASKVSGHGHFMSVDGRPLSAARGTMKQVLTLFKEALKNASSASQGVKEPFLYLEIQNPSASYDANVEPAKDDVLFEYEDCVLMAARNLFEGAYPKQSAQPPQEAVEGSEHAPNDDRAAELGFLSTKEDESTRLPSPPLLEEEHRSKGASVIDFADSKPIDHQASDGAANPSRAFRSKMYGCGEEDLELLDARPPTGRTEAEMEELRQVERDVTVSNPWVFAKLNATARKCAITQPAEIDQPPMNDGLAQHDTPSLMPPIALEAGALPTPQPSSPSARQTFHPSDHVPGTHFARDGRMIGNGLLPPQQLYVQSSPAAFYDNRRAAATHKASLYDNYPSSQAQAPSSTSPSDIAQAQTRPRRSPQKQAQQNGINKPFVCPVKDNPVREKVWFDHLENIDRRRAPLRRSNNSDGLVTQGDLSYLVYDPRPLTQPRRNRDMRDFVQSVDLTRDDSAAALVERRNFKSVQSVRPLLQARLRASGPDPEDLEDQRPRTPQLGFIKASELSSLDENDPPHPVAQRPVKRRRTSEGMALQDLSPNARTGAEDQERLGDEGGAETKSEQSRTANGNKTLRRKSSRLPLERIPAGRGTHNITHRVEMDCRKLSQQALELGQNAWPLWDEPAIETCDVFSSIRDPRMVSQLADKLRVLLVTRVSNDEMVQDLGELLHDAFEDHRLEDDDVADT